MTIKRVPPPPPIRTGATWSPADRSEREARREKAQNGELPKRDKPATRTNSNLRADGKPMVLGFRASKVFTKATYSD
jgi:hypothetical protein